MGSVLELDGFKARTVMPSGDVDSIEMVEPGWIGNAILSVRQTIYSRLRKRYAVPFELAEPEIVQSWIARVVTVRAYLKRGVNPSDAQFAMVKDDAESAMAEVKEAADSVDGLFDLPLVDALQSSAISKGGPFGYSEASPFVWTDVQRDRGTGEDGSRGGSYD